jgi:surface carbohydrate biosynthesis protein
MTQLKLITPIEIASRELLSKVYLSYLFACKGNLAYIGDKPNIYKLVEYLSNAIYIDRGYHPGKSEKIYDLLHENKTKIISMDEENGVDYEDFSTVLYRFPDKVFDVFDLVFLWGGTVNDFLKDNRKKFNQNKVFNYGHPKFELLKPKYHFLYDEFVNKYKHKYGKFILINTDFGLGNNVLGEKVVTEKYLSRIPNLAAIIDYHKLQVRNFIDLAVALSKLEGMNVVVRPHPEEEHLPYKKAFEGCGNVHVVYEDSVIPWMIAAEVMIHHDCTTSLEAAMLGKSSISYTKDLDCELTTSIPLQISYNLNNLSDVLNCIKEEKYKVINIKEDVLEDYFSYSEETSEKIIEKIINTFHVEDVDDKPIFFHKLIFTLKDLVRAILPVKNKLFEQKMKGLNKREVEKILKSLNEKYNTNIRVKKIHKFLFKIY